MEQFLERIVLFRHWHRKSDCHSLEIRVLSLMKWPSKLCILWIKTPGFSGSKNMASQSHFIKHKPHIFREWRVVKSKCLVLGKSTWISASFTECSEEYSSSSNGKPVILCGPLGINKTVNLNWATCSPEDKKIMELLSFTWKWIYILTMDQKI